MKEYRISVQAHELPRGGMPWRSLWWLAALAALSACAYSGTGCPDGSGRVRVWGDRGTVYTEIGRAELQKATRDVVEGSTLVIYRGEDGKLWARQEDEFEDGRFERLSETPGGAPR